MRESVYCIPCGKITLDLRQEGPLGQRVICIICGHIKIPAVSDETIRIKEITDGASHAE